MLVSGNRASDFRVDRTWPEFLFNWRILDLKTGSSPPAGRGLNHDFLLNLLAVIQGRPPGPESTDKKPLPRRQRGRGTNGRSNPGRLLLFQEPGQLEDGQDDVDGQVIGQKSHVGEQGQEQAPEDEHTGQISVNDALY
jgi:hypothetical protein